MSFGKEISERKGVVINATNDINNNLVKRDTCSHGNNNDVSDNKRDSNINKAMKFNAKSTEIKQSWVSFKHAESIKEINEDEENIYLKHVQTLNNSELQNREFIRRLANDFIHFRIHGKIKQDLLTVEQGNVSNSNEENFITSEKFHKTSNVLRKVSMELEHRNKEFFNKVCAGLSINEKNAKETFELVTEEVLNRDALNWGRVVSLFTFGGKVAEWFWKTQREHKIEEIEGWLTESISSTEDWMGENGGWDKFNETFEPVIEHGDSSQFSWWKPGLIICAGVSLAAVIGLKVME